MTAGRAAIKKGVCPECGKRLTFSKPKDPDQSQIKMAADGRIYCDCGCMVEDSLETEKRREP